MNIVCYIKGHIFKFSSGISDIHGQAVTTEYECNRCGKRLVIENENFKLCQCDKCLDIE